MGVGISTIEIPGEQNLLRSGRVAEEKDVVQVPLGEIEQRGHSCAEFKKHTVISFQEPELVPFSRRLVNGVCSRKIRNILGIESHQQWSCYMMMWATNSPGGRRRTIKIV